MERNVFISLSEINISKKRWEMIVTSKKKKLTRKQVAKQVERYRNGLKKNKKNILKVK